MKIFGQKLRCTKGILGVNLVAILLGFFKKTSRGPATRHCNKTRNTSKLESDKAVQRNETESDYMYESSEARKPTSAPRRYLLLIPYLNAAHVSLGTDLIFASSATFDSARQISDRRTARV